MVEEDINIKLFCLLDVKRKAFLTGEERAIYNKLVDSGYKRSVDAIYKERDAGCVADDESRRISEYGVELIIPFSSRNLILTERGEERLSYLVAEYLLYEKKWKRKKIVSKAKSWFEYVALALLAAWLAFFLGWS